MIKPTILQEGSYGDVDLESLNQSSIRQTKDIHISQLRELFEITHPELIGEPNFSQEQAKFVESRTGSLRGDWVYYPWSGTLVHCVGKDDYHLLRTNRNRELITQAEQRNLAGANIAIAGLSVGSNIALNLAYQGIASTLWLFEFDTLETTNLNRVKARLRDIGETKLDIVAQQLYELDPWIQINGQSHGLTEENIAQVLNTANKIDIFFEMIDDFEMKVRLRQKAKERGVPVVVAANLGDSLLVDIERYDLDPDLPIFNGLLGRLPDNILQSPEADKNEYAVKMVGKENIPPRALDSVKQIGKTLVGRPQLSSTVSINGGLSAYIARQIILGNPLPSGRYKIDLSQVLHL